MLASADYLSAKRQQEKRAQAHEAQEQTEYQLYNRINVEGSLSGPKGIKEIQGAVGRGELTTNQGERLIGQVLTKEQQAKHEAERRADKLEREREKQAREIEPLLAANETGLKLDHKSARDVKAVNQAFGGVLAANKSANPLEVAKQFYNKYGVMPTPVHNQIRGMLQSSDEKTARAGQTLAQSVEAIAPGYVGSLSHEEQARVQLIGKLPFNQVQDVINKGKSVTAEEKTVLSERLKADIPNFDKLAQRALGQSKVPIEAVAEARLLATQVYSLTGGDKSATEKVITDSLKSRWGVSTVSGEPVLMKNPPEGKNGEQKWMQEQFKQMLKPFGIDPKQTRLQPVSDGSNAYIVHLVNPDGTPNGVLSQTVTTKDGRQVIVPVQVRPDWESETQRQREQMQKQREQFLADEKAKAEKVRAESLRVKQMIDSDDGLDYRARAEQQTKKRLASKHQHKAHRNGGTRLDDEGNSS